jgi:Deoxycytidine deaminase
MVVLGKSELLKLQKDYNVIYPFDENLLDGDSFILTVQEDVEVKYLEHKNIVSHQIVYVPVNYVAHMTAKSKFGRLGLSFLNAAKVHSGFVGRIVLEVVNLNNEHKPILIKKGEPFMHLEFIKREGLPEPYHGEFMFQYMNENEIKMYLSILKNTMIEYEKYLPIWLKNKNLV